MDLSENNEYQKFLYRNSIYMQVDSSIAAKDRKDFEVNLRKKKRLIAYECYREFTNANAGEEFKRFIVEKNKSWEHCSIVNYDAFIDHARKRIARVEGKLGMNLCFDDFSEFFCLCQEVGAGMNRMIGKEYGEIMARVAGICRKRKEFALVVRISDLKAQIVRMICDAELKVKDSTFLSHFFFSVIENSDLNYCGKLNTTRIVNEKIRNKELLSDIDIAFMTKALENNENLVDEYFEDYYLRDNSDQFDQNLLSANHFSLILCSLVTVDLESIHESCNFFILDNFSKVLKSSSDLAVFNSLLGLQRLAEVNQEVAIEIVYNELIFSVFDKFHHPSSLISDQALSLILSLIQKDCQIISELLQRNLIQELSLKLNSTSISPHFLNLTIEILETSVEALSSLPFNIKNSFFLLLYQSAQANSPEHNERLENLIQTLSLI